jgi:septal ring factor EnvC (AmiA/AmiB activator)
MLKQEKIDRVRDTKETLDPVRDQINSLDEELAFETKYTIKMEKRLLKDVSENIEEQHTVIKNEKKERHERLTDIYDMLLQEVELQNKFFDNFEEKAKQRFNAMIQDVENELDSRLKHQDNILNDLKHFVDRFGKTMKVISNYD